MKNSFIPFFFVLILFGCGEAAEQLQEEFMPNSRGDVGEIILVADSAQWDGEIGSKLRSIFRQPMSGLPQDEPLFDVSKAGPRKLNSVLKSANNMIFVMTLDSKSRDSKTLRGFFTDQSLKKIQRDTSLFMTVQRDEFAKGQVVLFLFAQTEEMLVEKLETNRDRIQQFFESVERERIASRMYRQHEKNLEGVAAERHDFKIDIPYGWEQAASVNQFFWMRKLQADKEQNVFVYYEPYAGPHVFDDVPALRDRITEKFLRDSEKTDLFMTRQMREDIRAVFLKDISFKEQYAKEARGLWKLSDNSLGGPYVSYSFVDQDQRRLYYIEGYVAAPGSKKSLLIREIDAILSTFSSASIK